VKKDFWYLVGIAIVTTIVGGLANNRTHSNAWSHPNSWSFLGLLLSTWMLCGYTALMLSYQSGKKLPFTDLFTQWKYFLRVLGATILLGFIIGFGFIFFIIPGIYLALRFQLTITLIVDKNLGVFDAMRESSRLSQGIKLQILGFDFMILGVLLLGVLALGVGIFIALPVVWLAGVVVYRQVLSQQPASAPAA